MRYLSIRTARAGLVGGSLLMCAFQAGLAAGLPWGAAAWGGAHPGALPANLRLASAGGAAVWATLAYASSRISDSPETRIRTGAAIMTGLMGLGTVMNLISPSVPEKSWAVWCLVMCACAFSLARQQRESA